MRLRRSARSLLLPTSRPARERCRRALAAAAPGQGSKVDAASARWDTVRTELRAAGFNLPLVSNAQRHRTRSVLFAPAGAWTAEVERLRALLPGVEVEPLTWASKADVVLALGEEGAKK